MTRDPQATSHAEVDWLNKNNDTLQEDWLGQLAYSSVRSLIGRAYGARRMDYYDLARVVLS